MKWMQNNSVVKAMSKVGTVESRSNNYWVHANGHVASWWVQDGKVFHINVRRENDHDDYASDYFAGWNSHTIKAAVEDMQGN